MLDFLPMSLYTAIQNINTNLLYEMRLRVNQPVVISYAGRYIYLTNTGTSLNANMAIVATLQDIEECIYKASDYSIYAVTEQIQQGFITAKFGERIGLAGAYVYEGKQLQNIREITSLNIRVPHAVVGAADGIMQACLYTQGNRGEGEKKGNNLEEIPNILLCSSAGCGKTTILRDLAKQLSTLGIFNILLSDERNEITAIHCGQALELGCGIDVIRYAKKEDALQLGLRAMRPDIIITDEIVTREEVATLLQTYYSGVKIISTLHATSMDDLQNMPMLMPALQDKLFDYYVFLKSGSIGQIATIYDKNFQLVQGVR